MTFSGIKIPATPMVMLMAVVTVVLLALAAQQADRPLDLGGTRLLKQTTSASHPHPNCPPQASYGLGQKPGKGCGNHPPPGQN